MGVSSILRRFSTRGATCAAVIVAAGSASRMKGTDKIMAELGGEPLILTTLRAFQNSQDIQQIILVTREDLQEQISLLCVQKRITKVTKICKGGQTRAESVKEGLAHVSKDCDLVAIHDGARPLVTDAVIHDAVRKAAKFGAAAPGVPVKDTIKEVHGGVVDKTLDRASLYAIQTPQVFKADLIKGALTKAMKQGIPLTDDSSAMDVLGVTTYIVEGEEENIKLTKPLDLLLAAAILKDRRERDANRTGL